MTPPRPPINPTRPAALTRALAARFTVCLAFWIIALLTLSAIAQTTHANARDPRQLFVATSPELTWLVRPTTGAAKTDPSWTVLRRPSDAKANDVWQTVALLKERPQTVAAFGERLAVLYTDGTWTLTSTSGQINGPSAQAAYKLVNVSGGVDRLTFLAQVFATPDDFCFIDFDGRSLSDPRPVELTNASPDRGPRRATIRPGVNLIVDLDNPDPFEDVAQTSDGEFYATRSAEVLRVVFGVREASIDAQAAKVSGRLTLSRDLNGDARFWWLDGGKVYSRGVAVDGSFKGDADAVAIAAPPSPPLFERGLYAVGALTLLLVLLAGGRQTLAVTRALATKNPPAPAPMARRFAAGVVDCIPLVATTVYLAASGKLTLFGGMLRFDSTRSEAILAAGVLLYLTLLFAFEIRWGKSIGKLMFALRVVSIDGGPARPRAILIRNILRLVDLNLITLLIVPATPLRQRLGDFLAGTMVIDALDPKSSAQTQVTADEPADKE